MCLTPDFHVLKMNAIATHWFTESGQLALLESSGLGTFFSLAAMDQLLQHPELNNNEPQASNAVKPVPLVHLTLPGATEDTRATEHSGAPSATPKTLEMRLQRVPPDGATKENAPDTVLLLGVIRDVSSRVGVERALDAARLSAEEASAAKTDILYSVSHDIRTPLNGALGFLDLLRKTELDTQQLDYVNTVDKSTRSMMSIIEQLLDVARIEAGYLDFDATATDIDKLLQECVQLHQPEADAKKLSLSYRDSGDTAGMLVNVDAARLIQVVNNLLTNAIKFTIDGDIVVQMQMQPGDNNTQRVSISVADTGIGIYPDEMERLFDAYERSQRALTRRAGGVGLGLAISRRIVEGLGGTIEVESTPNVGSTFYVTLELPIPLHTDVATSSASADKPFRASKVIDNPKVLAVDDSDINLSYLVATLSHHDVEVSSALGGQQAIEAVTANPHDLIMLDIHMPAINGFDVLRKIDELYGETRPPVIALTADASNELKSDVDHAGFNDRLFKPVSEQDLLDLLHRFTGLEITPTRKQQQSKPATSTIDRNFGVQMAGNNEKLWHQNLSLFSTQLKEMLTDLSTNTEQSDRDFVAQVSHKIAGTASYLGAAVLTTQAKAVNDCARDPSRADLDAQVRKLVQVSQNFLLLASDILNSPKTPAHHD